MSPLRLLLSAIVACALTFVACGTAARPAATGPGDQDPEDGDAGTGTRTVATALGPVEIPEEPERMVVDWVTFDNLAVLGHDLSTVADVFELSFFLENPAFSPSRAELARDLGLTGAVGATYELNVEALAALEPDVVLLAEDQAPEQDVLDTLTEVAPVVVYDLPDGAKSFAQWQAGLESLAEVLGGDAPAAAADAIASFDARVEQVRQTHADLVDSVEISIGNILEDQIRLSMEGRNIGTEVAAAIGLARPVAQLELPIDEYHTVLVSPERLPLIDADIIFLEQRVEDLADLEANPLYQGLPAVQAGAVHFVPNYWEFGGAGAAQLVLDDIEAALEQYAAGEGGHAR